MLILHCARGLHLGHEYAGNAGECSIRCDRAFRRCDASTIRGRAVFGQLASGEKDLAQNEAQVNARFVRGHLGEPADLDEVAGERHADQLCGEHPDERVAGRLVTMAEIADTTDFLLRNAGMSAHALNVDGGMLIT
ncbi:hypothetical protein [Streptomyces sp. NBC_00258]|jgi:hypothetical protein|uniref:hypothetical protein n=1 Tax=Streptomyces sp. NBC_00258 TaxID=2903642 RepID=UPI002E28A9D2|nr:hypothetical protein [Streptomyces sp. NBC_00258]